MSKKRTIGDVAAHLLASRRITPSNCWEWLGSKSKDGYGQLTSKIMTGKHWPVKVHRVAAALWLNLDINSEIFVLHRCDNPGCFNPHHLFFGTQAENNKDKMLKRRTNPPRGERSGTAKLSRRNVEAILSLRLAGLKPKFLAAIFDVSESLISHIATGRAWAHIAEATP